MDRHFHAIQIGNPAIAFFHETYSGAVREPFPLTIRTRPNMMCTHQSIPSRVSMAESMAAVPRPCACTTVRRVSRILARIFDVALESAGLNVTQLAVLRAIERHPNEPLTRVAEDLCMDRTSLYRSITPMLRDGWLKIVSGPDARSRVAEFTAKGRRVLAAADRPWGKLQTEVIARFGPENWASLVSELQRLAACAQTTEIAQDPSRANRAGEDRT